MQRERVRWNDRIAGFGAGMAFMAIFLAISSEKPMKQVGPSAKAKAASPAHLHVESLGFKSAVEVRCYGNAFVSEGTASVSLDRATASLAQGKHGRRADTLARLLFKEPAIQRITLQPHFLQVECSKPAAGSRTHRSDDITRHVKAALKQAFEEEGVASDVIDDTGMA